LAYEDRLVGGVLGGIAPRSTASTVALGTPTLMRWMLAVGSCRPCRCRPPAYSARPWQWPGGGLLQRTCMPVARSSSCSPSSPGDTSGLRKKSTARLVGNVLKSVGYRTAERFLRLTIDSLDCERQCRFFGAGTDTWTNPPVCRRLGGDLDVGIGDDSGCDGRPGWRFTSMGMAQIPFSP